jgi:2-succinyl-6-hydroxy-2,4-cyclohexadiene-1-carboxylate synthase
MEGCVHDLLDLLDARHIRQVVAVGYSMGGRVALHLALAAPRRVRGLVLESASPGIEDPDQRAERVASDEALAALVERDGIEAFVERWERLPLLALGPDVPDEVRAGLRAQRLAHHPRGLAGSLRGMGAGRSPPVWHRLPELDMPVLLVVGARDARYRALAERMRQALPRARLEVVQDAGHMPHVERPAAFGSLVEDFFLSVTQCRMLA